MSDRAAAADEWRQEIGHDLNHKQRRAAIKKWKRKIKRRATARRREEDLAATDHADSPHQIEQQRLKTVSIELDKRKRDVEHKLWLKRELTERLKNERKQLEMTNRKIQADNKIAIDDQALDDMAFANVAGPSTKQSGRTPSFWNRRFTKETTSRGDCREDDDESIEFGRLTPCPLYEATGACRFGRKCAKLHPSVRRSRILLLANMYRHPTLDREPSVSATVSTTNAWMEYDDEELRAHYVEFMDDVRTELASNFGPLRRFIVCRNQSAHLRGNVLVEFEREKDAYAAYVGLSGRFYDGRQLYPAFRRIPSWKAAICAEYLHGRCSRDDQCTYLHIFEELEHRRTSGK